jgi:hypothetical protein
MAHNRKKTTINPSDQPAASDDFPGRKLGVIGLLLACTLNFVGLIVSLVALTISHRNGVRNPAAVAGIVIGAVATVVLVAATFYVVGVLDGDVGVCAELGPGVHEQGTMTYTCEGVDAS